MEKTITSNFKVQPMIEPIHQNQWILSFPDDFNIPEFSISKISSIKYSNDKGWKKITITILDLIGVNITKNLIENLVRLPLKVTLKKLDPTGECVETIMISSKKINVNYGKFNYASDNLNKIKVTLTPKNLLVF